MTYDEENLGMATPQVYTIDTDHADDSVDEQQIYKRYV